MTQLIYHLFNKNAGGFKTQYMKFKIRKLTISYSKILAKNNRKIKNDLENQLKDLEKTI